MFQGELEWHALDTKDSTRMKEFMPDTIHQVTFGDDIGGREFLVAVTGRGGFDIKRRSGREYTTMKQDFFGVSG
jgi:hypothetical protein